MSSAAILGLALLLDAALGEPRWLWSRLPHPAILMGRLVGFGDKHLNHGSGRKLKGTLLIFLLAAAMLCLGFVIACFGWLPQVILCAMLLAQRSLANHVAAVGNALRLSIGDGQRAVGMIVSRDTTDMDASAVARSAIESGAENLSDGVIAPAFWFLIGGLPGLLVYKIVNTADSMIGYRTPKYEQFGWAAARLDDVLNWVPARLTAFLIAATHSGLGAWAAIRSDAAKHRSPNAGWPESAMARALDVAISGPRTYDGEIRDFPFVHEEGRKTLGPDDIDDTCRALWHTWGAFTGLTFVLIVLW